MNVVCCPIVAVGLPCASCPTSNRNTRIQPWLPLPTVLVASAATSSGATDRCSRGAISAPEASKTTGVAKIDEARIKPDLMECLILLIFSHTPTIMHLQTGSRCDRGPACAASRPLDRLGQKPVSHPGLGAHGAGGGGGGVELPAQGADVDADGVGSGGGSAAPDGADDLPDGDRPSRLAGEELEDGELGGGEAHLAAALGDGAPGKVDLEVGEAEDGGRRRSGGAAEPRAAELRPHAGQELTGGEGLADVVVGAEVEGAHLVLLLATHRQHDQGSAVDAPHRRDERQAVGPRH